MPTGSVPISELLGPYVVETSGINIFLYPGTRSDFADDLQNMGLVECLPKFALKFKDVMIDMDLLFYVVDLIKTSDGGLIFYSPENKTMDLKIITRPADIMKRGSAAQKQQ
jgi:hypothetical protein